MSETSAVNDETCGHCGRPFATAPRGTAADGTVLCHTGTIPPGDDPPDCFRLCTVYQHATDGSCCPDGNISPWRPSLPADFDGCGRGCRMAGVHTLKWGECDHAEQPPRPEPEFGYWATRVASDGGPSPGLARIPLLAVLPWAESLSVDQRHEMLEAAATAEDPAATIEEWRTAALGGPDAEQVDLRFSPKEMRDLRRIAREQDTTVDELIRTWLHERLQPARPSPNTPGAMLSINMGTAPADPPPGINAGVARAMYEHGRRQGRHEAGGR